jgi:23S rRNA (uracil1939-C5)-methyltransferase
MRVSCDHAERCGGCPLIDRTYDEQLAVKHSRAVRAVSRYQALDGATIEPVAPAEPIVGYRPRAKLIVASGGAIGLYARGGGHRVVDIPGCRVLAPALAAVAQALRERVAAAEARGGALAPFGPGTGALRAVDLREVRETADEESARVLVTFVIERSRAPDLGALREAAAELMEAAPRVAGVAVNFHEGEAPQILGGETVPLAGAAEAPDRTGASVHVATFGSFVQAHRGQAERVHALLAAAIGLGRGAPAGARPPRILDLYGGSGAIGLALAAAGARVVLVESFAPAVEQAAAAARAQGLEVEAVCSDVATALAERAARRERFDAVVVNPPRRGTSPRVRQAIASLDPAVIAYVSCDPETLARDLAHLGRLGYAAASLQPVDMIPLTDELETVAVLRRAPPATPDVVYEDPDVLVVDKSPHEPTTPQGGYAGSLLARVRRIAGAEEAVPVHQLDAGSSGLVLFARRGAGAAKWQRALGAAEARVTHLAGVRGVTSPKGGIAGIRYRRLSKASGHSVLRVTAAGADGASTHPMRRRFATLGHPVLGDERFGHAPTNRYFEEKCGLDRPFLHCARLELLRPGTAAPLTVEAPLPGDLLAVLERMGAALS